MKVLENLKELQKEGIIVVWIRDNITKEEFIYNTKGYSSIENPEYIKAYENIFNKEVEDFDYINTSVKEARITYKV